MTPEQTDKLHQTLSAVLGVPADQINDDTSPDNVSAWDSVMHLNLVLALEEAFATSFTPEETLEMTSAKLIRLILEEKGI
jgi:acyl carrier protein